LDEAKIKKLAAVLFDHDSIPGVGVAAGGATEGERTNAAAMLARLASKDRNQLVEALLSGMTKKPNGALSETDAKRIYDAGFNDGLRKAENAQHGPGNFRNVDGTPSWNEIALWCQRRADQLRDNERQFIDDMAGRTVWREPTEKQGMWLMSIFYRLGGPK